MTIIYSNIKHFFLSVYKHSLFLIELYSAYFFVRIAHVKNVQSVSRKQLLEKMARGLDRSTGRYLRLIALIGVFRGTCAKRRKLKAQTKTAD